MAIPRLKYFITCDEVKNEGGKFSAIGIFDTIFSFIYPATHQRFFVLIGCVGAAGRFGLELQFSDPEGRPFAKATGELVLPSDQQVGNAVFVFERFPLPVQGMYTISVFLDGDFFAEHHFRVHPPFPKRDRTSDEIATLLAQPNIIKSAHVDVACDQCKAVYRFQKHLDPNQPVDQGFLPVPPGEFFICAVCGKRLQVKQVRENLDNIVGIPQQWLGPGSSPQAKPPDPTGNKDEGADPAPGPRDAD